MPDHAVLLDGVTKHYGSGAQAVVAVDDITLDVQQGEFVSITGPSGCGKSTLLNLVAGLDWPTSGSVTLCGRELADLDDDQRSDLRLATLGFVFQSFNLLPAFTAVENVAWPLAFLRLPFRKAKLRAMDVLHEVGVDRAAFDRHPAELSGGEQQRIAIARALVAEPRVVLADEPTGNLDSRTGQGILDLLRRLNVDRDLTVIMVTHSAFAATYGHRTIELRDGEIVREIRTPSEPARVVPIREGCT